MRTLIGGTLVWTILGGIDAGPSSGGLGCFVRDFLDFDGLGEDVLGDCGLGTVLTASTAGGVGTVAFTNCRACFSDAAESTLGLLARLPVDDVSMVGEVVWVRGKLGLEDRPVLLRRPPGDTRGGTCPVAITDMARGSRWMDGPGDPATGGMGGK